MEKPFYDIEEFPDLKMVAEKYATILEELKKNSFWMNWGSDNYDPMGHCEFLTGDWTVCPVYFGHYDPHKMKIPINENIDVDEVLEALPQSFPETIKILKTVTSLNFAAFSRLHPKSALAPHRHFNPLSLIFHLGLLIPSGNTCGIRVGKETRFWTKPGDAFIFNDNIEHSAWNHSDEERIILYIDFRR